MIQRHPRKNMQNDTVSKGSSIMVWLCKHKFFDSAYKDLGSTFLILCLLRCDRKGTAAKKLPPFTQNRNRFKSTLTFSATTIELKKRKKQRRLSQIDPVYVPAATTRVSAVSFEMETSPSSTTPLSKVSFPVIFKRSHFIIDGTPWATRVWKPATNL